MQNHTKLYRESSHGIIISQEIDTHYFAFFNNKILFLLF